MSPNSDEMNSVDLQNLVKSEIKSKNFYMETIPADFAFKIRDGDEQEVDFDREVGRGKSNIVLFTRVLFDAEKICVLVPILKTPILDDDDEDIDNNTDGDENCDDDCENSDEGESSDNNGGENSDNNGGENSDEGKNSDNNGGEKGDGGDRGRGGGAPASFTIGVEIIKQNGKTLRFNVSAADNDITVESMWIKFGIDDSFSHAASYMVDRDGDLQSGLKEYLKSRGINKSIVDFMYKYVVRKAKQAARTPVLNHLQAFMEED